MDDPTHHAPGDSSAILDRARRLAADVLAIMVAILAVGLLMDTVVFSRLERMVLERRGLLASR